MACNKPDCPLCQTDRDGCQCRTKDIGCWYCAPNKFNRPECDPQQGFRDWKAGLSRQVDAKIAEVCERYDIEKMPEHIYAKQNAMVVAPTKEEAERIFKKLMTWSIIDAGIATGHAQEDRISEKAAKKAEALADFLEGKGDAKGAARQRRRAASIRKELSQASRG